MVRIPSIDIVEVGAGGGSVAWIDRGGALRVGPQGAGATPGPVCYGLGGTEPTVTDANVVLGYLNPETLAGGTVPIDRAAAYDAISERLAQPLGLTVLEAALGIIRVVDATMMRALRSVSIERGVDPRGLTLVAFGGAGPLHAVRLADALGVHRVLVPIFPGVFSALGLLLAEFRQDAMRSIMMPLGAPSIPLVESTFEQLTETVRVTLVDGIGRPPSAIRREIDVQYENQGAPLTLPVPDDIALSADELADRFRTRHHAEYGFEMDVPQFITAVRVRGTAPAESLRLSDMGSRIQASEASSPSEREAYFGDEHGWLTVPVRSRAQLEHPADGPLIIDEADSCVLVPAGWQVSRQESANLLVSRP